MNNTLNDQHDTIIVEPDIFQSDKKMGKNKFREEGGFIEQNSDEKSIKDKSIKKLKDKDATSFSSAESEKSSGKKESPN